MSTSRESFTQVKDILRKLDRSIDEAREKREREEGITKPTSAGEQTPPQPAQRPGEDVPQRAKPMASPKDPGTDNPFHRRVG